MIISECSIQIHFCKTPQHAQLHIAYILENVPEDAVVVFAPALDDKHCPKSEDQGMKAINAHGFKLAYHGQSSMAAL